MFSIDAIDWLIIAFYLLGLIAMAWWLSRGQYTREDYYFGHRAMGSWLIAISIMATQCSTNSILGAGFRNSVPLVCYSVVRAAVFNLCLVTNG